MYTKLKYKIETVQLEDSIVAIPVGDHASQFHGVIKVNKTGASILKMLMDDVSEERIIELMAKEFDVPRGKLEADIRQFISTFQERGLLV